MSTSQVAEEDLTFPVPAERGGLNEPWRALVAGGELVLAALALWLAYVLWPHGIAEVVQTTQDGRRVVTTQWYGSWMGSAIALGAVSAVLVVDAVRQLILAVRARPRRTLKHAAHS